MSVSTLAYTAFYIVGVLLAYTFTQDFLGRIIPRVPKMAVSLMSALLSIFSWFIAVLSLLLVEGVKIMRGEG